MHSITNLNIKRVNLFTNTKHMPASPPAAVTAAAMIVRLKLWKITFTPQTYQISWELHLKIALQVIGAAAVWRAR